MSDIVKYQSDMYVKQCMKQDSRFASLSCTHMGISIKPLN